MYASPERKRWPVSKIFKCSCLQQPHWLQLELLAEPCTHALGILLGRLCRSTRSSVLSTIKSVRKDQVSSLSQTRNVHGYCTRGVSAASSSTPSTVAAPASRRRYWRSAVTKVCWRSDMTTAPRTDSKLSCTPGSRSSTSTTCSPKRLCT